MHDDNTMLGAWGFVKPNNTIAAHWQIYKYSSNVYNVPEWAEYVTKLTNKPYGWHEKKRDCGAM